MRPSPAVKAKAHPKWREDPGVRCTLPSLLSMGRPAMAPVEHCRLQQVVKEPGPRWVDALGGSASAAKRWKGKKAAMKKARNHLVAGPLLERSGGRTLWGYCPALQPPPGGGAVSSKPLLPSHCGWLPLPCKYALNAMRCCDADSRLARDGMDAECACKNGDDPRTATAPWQGRRRMAVRMAFTMGFRRKVVRWWSRGGGHGVLMDGDCK